MDPCERQGIQLALWLQNDLPRSRPPRNVNPWSTASAPFGRVKCTRMAFKAVRVKSLLGRILVAPHCKRGSDGIVQSDKDDATSFFIAGYSARKEFLQQLIRCLFHGFVHPRSRRWQRRHGQPGLQQFQRLWQWHGRWPEHDGRQQAVLDWI